MRNGKALTQHLQVLQSGQPLDAPWHDAPIGAVGILQVPSAELFANVEAADTKRLQEVVRTAEFWIALLEGERSDLAEEVVKHKQRHQLAARQRDTQAKALREAENEKKKLEKDLRRLEESRDQAIGDRALARQDAKKLKQSQSDSTKTQQELREMDMTQLALKDELQQEREEKEKIEGTLVRLKFRHVEALQRIDSMEVLIKHYEDKLSEFNPNFERIDLSTLSARTRLHDSPAHDTGAESDASGRSDHEEDTQKHLKRGVSFRQAVSKVKDFLRKPDRKSKSSKNDSAIGEEGAEAPEVERQPSNLRPNGSEEGQEDLDGGQKPNWMLRNEVQ